MKELLDLAERTLILQYSAEGELLEAMLANKENWVWRYNEEDAHYAVAPRTADGRGPPGPFSVLKYDYHDVLAIAGYRR